LTRRSAYSLEHFANAGCAAGTPGNDMARNLPILQGLQQEASRSAGAVKKTVF